jgi:4'-phosphopantetheinyl transferase
MVSGRLALRAANADDTVARILLRYCLTELEPADALAAAIDLLSADERNRLERFVRSADRRDFAFAHALLRRTLTDCGDRPPRDWSFIEGASGKPGLAPDAGRDAGLSFNLTHTNGVVACAVTKGRAVGVDVEAIDRRLAARDLAGKFFSPAEARAVFSSTASVVGERFIETWVLKEAFVKALGTGLGSRLDDFAFALDQPSTIRFDPPPGVAASRWLFALFAPTDRHRLAIALENDGGGDASLVAQRVDGESVGGELAPVRTSGTPG